MRKAAIHISFYDKTFNTEFEISDQTKEYEIADRAYDLAMLFAKTQILAAHGHSVPSYEFEKCIHYLDYDYEIKE